MICVTSDLLIKKKKKKNSKLLLKITEKFWEKRCEEVGGLIPRELFMMNTIVGHAECLESQ